MLHGIKCLLCNGPLVEGYVQASKFILPRLYCISCKAWHEPRYALPPNGFRTFGDEYLLKFSIDEDFYKQNYWLIRSTMEHTTSETWV